MCSQVIRGLFQAHPPADLKSYKGFQNHLEECIAPSSGLQDSYDLVSHLAGIVELISSPFSEIGQLASKVKDVFDLLGLGLSVPKGVQNLNALHRSVSHLSELAFEQPLKVARAIKDVIIDSLLAVNGVLKIRLFINSSGLASLTAYQAARYSMLISLTFLIADGSDLIKDCIEWQEAGISQEKQQLAFMNVLKNTSSVATSALALVGFVFAPIVSNSLFIGAILISSTVFFISKFSSYFYAKMVVQSQDFKASREGIILS